LIAERFLYVPDTLIIDDSQNHNLIFSLETVHQNSILIDLHNDVLEKVVKGYDLGKWNSSNHSDLPRFYKGGVDVQFMALWVDPSTYSSNPFQQTLKMIDSFKVQLNKYNLNFAQAKNSKEIDSLVSIGKFAAVLCVEGGHAIENDIYKLDSLYKLGVRYLTITWNNSTSWATSAQDPQAATKGLSEFGRQVIRHMDSLGMLIDVSHVGPKTIDDILETTTNPIIATHSGVKALRNHYRNLTDQQIIKIAQKGGVIGVIFYPPYLTTASSAYISNVIAHIEYIKNLVGIDYIALGSDFDGIERVVVGLEDVTKFPNLTEALLRRGFSISDVMKILGENFLRVFRQVCK
jgi:membrane dipeptidase